MTLRSLARVETSDAYEVMKTGFDKCFTNQNMLVPISLIPCVGDIVWICYNTNFYRTPQTCFQFFEVHSRLEWDVQMPYRASPQVRQCAQVSRPIHVLKSNKQ